MRRLRWMGGMAAAVVAVALAAPAAHAGNYSVVSCGAPGADGVNLAWTPRFTDFTNPSNGQYFPPEPQFYDLEDACSASPSRLEARPKVGGEGRAGFLRGAQWRFEAPSGTRIVQLTTWRFGVKLRTNRDGDPDPNVEGDQGDPWEIAAVDAETAAVIGGGFGETCDAQPGAIGCEFGKDTGVTDASRAVYPVNTRAIAYQVLCGSLSGCDRYFQDFPIARVKLFGSRVTMSDTIDPRLEAGGPLFEEGFRRSTDTVTATSSDGAGIRAVRLEVDGAVIVREELGCDYRRPAPCPASDRRTFSLADRPLADGQHTVAVVAEDAGANEQRVEKVIRVDANGPQVAIERLKGRTISAAVSDLGSGVASGAIDVRDAVTAPYRPLATRLEGGRLVAELDRGSASRVGVRITARDGAGNTTVVEGSPTRISLGRAQVGKRAVRVRRGRVRAGSKAKVAIRGILRGADGAPLGGRPLTLTARLRRSGAGRQPLGTVTTGPDGRFTAQVPPGASRVVRLDFHGQGGGLPSARSVSVRVPARSTLRVSPRRVGPGGRVRFRGRLTLAGQEVARGGKLIELQAFDRGRWRVFESARARGDKAAWRSSYKFGSRPGRYPIRVRIRRESTFPFELGYSRRVVVRVG